MVNSQSAVSPVPTRVMFARIGWMTYYAGPQEGDERPSGGGAYNRRQVGHEVFNFAKFDGQLYGFARTEEGRLNLKRIDPNAVETEKLEDVLIIFVARQYIVGWYSKAIVYAHNKHKFPASVARDIKRRIKDLPMRGFKLEGYLFEAKSEDSILLPLPERSRKKWRVPGNIKGGFGEYNIRYLYRRNGAKNCPAWMNKAIEQVLNYNGPDLLTDQFPQLNSEEAAELAHEKSQGFHSDPKIRKLIEEHAMEEAKKELKKCGYHDFKRTSATRPYDYTCVRNGGQFFVEVKGTQTTGNGIILTRNEVEHVNANPNRCVLVVVHSVKVSGDLIAKSGATMITETWNLAEGDLTETQFLWKRKS